MKELVIISVLMGCCFGVNIGVNIALARAYEQPKTPKGEEMQAVHARIEQRIDKLFERITHENITVY